MNGKPEVLAHMIADARDHYFAWLDRLARRAKGRMRDYLNRCAEAARENSWGFIQ